MDITRQNGRWRDLKMASGESKRTLPPDSLDRKRARRRRRSKGSLRTPRTPVLDGQGNRRPSPGRENHEASSGTHLQTFQRQTICREVGGCGRFVSAENAIVLSCDQMQALDRTQPGLPLKKGRCGTLTQEDDHDVRRAQYAGRLDYRDLYAEASSSGMDPVSQIRSNVPCRKTNRSISFATTAQTSEIVRGRLYLHFTPTSASWLNMVERFFRDLSEQRLRRGVFQANPGRGGSGVTIRTRPFIWTATASDILGVPERSLSYSLFDGASGQGFFYRWTADRRGRRLRL